MTNLFLDWKAYGLVDLNCKRVYAVKVMVWTKVSASVAYVPLDLYGYVDEAKPIKPAVETHKLPGTWREKTHVTNFW